MFQALNQDSRLSTGLRTGDLAGLRLFTDRVAPLIAAARMKDDFAVMAQLRATSPLLQRAAIARLAHTDDPLLPIRAAVEALLTLDTDGQETTFLAVLECVAKHRLFEILMRYAHLLRMELKKTMSSWPAMRAHRAKKTRRKRGLLRAWRPGEHSGSTVQGSRSGFAEYVSDKGPLGTHQCERPGV